MPRGKGQTPLLASHTTASHQGGSGKASTACPKVEAAGLMLPHSTFPVTPERQGTLSHGPLCHCGLSPSHHSGSTLQAAAIFVLQSRAGPSGCRPHVASVVAARRGAWLVGTRLLSQCCCSQRGKLAPRGYQLLTSEVPTDLENKSLGPCRPSRAG